MSHMYLCKPLHANKINGITKGNFKHMYMVVTVSFNHVCLIINFIVNCIFTQLSRFHVLLFHDFCQIELRMICNKAQT